jgi:hypothetical protein
MPAYGAALTSRGVATAVRIVRLGRVVGLVVTMLVLQCAAPMALAILLSRETGPVPNGWVSISPF